MKTLKTPFILILIVLAISLNACVNSTESKYKANKFYKQYKSEKNVISFNLPPALLRVFIDSDEKELKEILRDIDDMRFLVFEDAYFCKISPKTLYQQINKDLQEEGFQDLMIINDGNEKITFKVKEENAIVEEFIMLVSSGSELIFVNLSGTMDLDKMDLIVESFDVRKTAQFY